MKAQDSLNYYILAYIACLLAMMPQHELNERTNGASIS